jgi:hypothetical protein
MQSQYDIYAAVQHNFMRRTGNSSMQGTAAHTGKPVQDDQQARDALV